MFKSRFFFCGVGDAVVKDVGNWLDSNPSRANRHIKYSKREYNPNNVKTKDFIHSFITVTSVKDMLRIL